MSHLTGAFTRRLSRERDTLNQVATRPVLQRPTNIIEQYRGVIDTQSMRLHSAFTRRMGRERTALAQAFATLSAVSPQATLERGYSILRLSDGSVLRDAADTKKADLVEAILARGRLVAQVIGTNPTATSAWADTTTSQES